MTDSVQVQVIALVLIIFILAIWEIVWKLIGMWKAGKNNQLAWFIIMGLINSMGIIPLIYIAFFQKKYTRRFIR